VPSPGVKHVKSRIHLLAAKAAPTLVILQRKRAKPFHVITVNTQTHSVEEGSWFRGVLHVLRCDVSFDGRFMIYMAVGGRYKVWSGVCRLPWLKTVAEGEEHSGIAWGGGYFAAPQLLITNGRKPLTISAGAELPFTLMVERRTSFSSYGTDVIYKRFERDGFMRLGDNWGREHQTNDPYRVDRIGDDGWGNRPFPRHPQLKVCYIGFIEAAERFAFSLDEHPDVVAGASWATWDADGNLWVARPGVVEKFTLDDLRCGMPSFSLDVDQFAPNAKDDPRTVRS